MWDRTVNIESFTLPDNGSSPLLSFILFFSIFFSLFYLSLIRFRHLLLAFVIVIVFSDSHLLSPLRFRCIFFALPPCFALTWINIQSLFASMRRALAHHTNGVFAFINCITIYSAVVYNIDITSWNSLNASDSSSDKYYVKQIATDNKNKQIDE